MKKKRMDTLGLPPTTLVAPAGAVPPKSIDVFNYTEQSVEENHFTSVADLAGYVQKPGVTWIDVSGLADVELLGALGSLLGLHPLALEDVLSIPQRPKVDDYESHLYIVMGMLHFENLVELEQVSVFLGPRYVVTFQEHPGDCLDPVRDRIRKGKGQIRRKGADYLMYSIIDTIIDNYFPFLEKIGEAVEELETHVIANPSRRTLGQVNKIKRSLLDVRRAVWPLRDGINVLLREESPLIDRPSLPYLRDCYDHAVQILDIVETYRELASGLMDVYLSSVSNKMNEVMKVLTVIATIFIPLTFIVGIYGMNFNSEKSPLNMPELNWYWGYPVVWVIMVLVALVMIVFFWRKGWLSGGNDEK